MEKISESRLPDVFKMSMLCNILPYYGHLHKWKELLESINTGTKEVWKQNRDQLIYLGANFKKEIELDCKRRIEFREELERDYLNLFTLSLSLDFNETQFDFMFLIEKIGEDEALVLDAHTDLFKAFKIYYCKKESISELIKLTNCSSSQQHTKKFQNSEMTELNDYINNKYYSKSFLIEIKNENVYVYFMNSHILKLSQKTLDYYIEEKHFNLINDKPKKINAITNEVCKLQYIIDKLDEFSSIKDIQFGVYLKHEIFSPYYSSSNEQKYIITFKNQTKLLNTNYPKLLFSGEILKFVYNGKALNFKLYDNVQSSVCSSIIGIKLIENDCKEYFALKITEATLLLLAFQNLEDSSDVEDFIKYIQQISLLENTCYIIFDKNEICLKATYQQINKDIDLIDFCSAVDIKVNIDLEVIDIIEALNHIPKNLSFRLEINNSENLIRIMKCEKLVEILMKQRARFLYFGNEIQIKLIKSEYDEENVCKEIYNADRKLKHRLRDMDKLI